jgi:autotransporter translocation and assembly factor TamB
MLKKIFKILSLVLLSAISLVLLLIVLISTGVFNGYIARTAEKIAGKSINGKLEIGSLKGNILSAFSLNGILLTLGQDTIMKCDTIEIGYSPASLLKKRIDIRNILISNLNLNLEQNHDSVWNFMQLLKTDEEKDTVQGEFNMTVNLMNISLTGMTATISPAEKNQFIPEFLSSDLNMSAFISGDTIKVRLNDFRLLTRAPEFEVKKLSGTFSKTGELIGWKDVLLQLNRTLATTKGNFSMDGNGSANIRLNFSPLSIDELLVFLPGVELHGSPEISVSLEGDAADYSFNANLKEKDQALNIDGSLKDYKNNPGYSALMKVENLDGSYWTGDEKLKSNISGSLSFTGRGFDIRENRLALKGEFGEVQYGKYGLSDLTLNVTKENDNAAGNLDFRSFAGDMILKFDLRKIFTIPVYNLDGNFRNVDPSKVAEMDSLKGKLNGKFNLRGTGTSPKIAEVTLSLHSEGSEIAQQPISDFSLTADYTRGDYNFEIGDLTTPFFEFRSAGSGNIYKSIDAGFEMKLLNVTKLGKLFGLQRLNATGDITGKVTGQLDSLTASGNLSLANVMYDSIIIGKLDADFDLNLADSLYRLSAEASGISAGKMKIRSTNLTADIDGDLIDAGLDVTVNDSLSAGFRGTIKGFEDPVIRIGALDISYSGSKWSAVQDSASVRLGKEDILINGFSLSSGSQSISIDGKFSFNGEQDLNAAIENVELRSLPTRQFLPFDLSGLLNFHISLSGTSENPLLSSTLSIDDPVINKYNAGNISADASYENESFKIKGNVNMPDYRLIDLTANIPFHVSFKDSIYLLRDNPGFSAALTADSLDLSQISDILSLKGTGFSGIAKAGISLGNRLSDPEIKGSLQISNGKLKNKKFGISYDDIRLRSYIDSSLVRIKEFTASSGRKGKISIYGAMGLGDSTSAGQSGLSLSITADDFQALNSDMAELNFDSDLKLTAGEGKPRFDGGITINNSEVNVDYFGSFFSEVKDDPNPPLLIEALGDTIKKVKTSDTLKFIAALPGSDFFKKLAGEAVLHIPGNTWVRGKDMNAELDGDLRVIKKEDAISLFGELNIRRGFYKLYGKRFDFEQGKVSFTGASELNPDLDIQVVYKFRDVERQLKELKLAVKGRLKDPQFTFTLDDRELEEKDAISYIVFGRSINELSENEKSKVGGNDNIAMNAAFSGLASVLKDVLQQTTGLDVLEISGENDWKSTNVTIGKYITNKLYISYEQSFNFDRQSKVIYAEKFMLEYHILRNLILKATNQEINSGFDLIYTKKWR